MQPVESREASSLTPDSKEASSGLPRPKRWMLVRSLIKIIRDPEETSHGARLVLTFDRKQSEKNFQKFRDHPMGSAILEGAPSLYERLTDRDGLVQLPEGSLGRHYLAYILREGISTEGLDAEVAPVEMEVQQPDAPRRRFSQHMRASHDLWHVLTGYHRDLLGELQLLTFSHGQNGSPSFKWLARLARFGAGRKIEGARELLDLAARRGQTTQDLATSDWAKLLPLPIEDVRDIVGLGAPPNYVRHVRNPNGRGLVPEQIENHAA